MKKRTPDKVSFEGWIVLSRKGRIHVSARIHEPPSGQGLGGSLLESRFSDTALAWPCHGREDAFLSGCRCIHLAVEPAGTDSIDGHDITAASHATA